MSGAPEDVAELELARAELGERLKRQGDEVRAVDSKAQVVLAFAVTALTFTLEAEMPGAAKVAAGVLFLPALVLAGFALSVSRYRDPVDQRALVADHLGKGREHLLMVVVNAHCDALTANDDVLRRRVQAWRSAVAFLAAAVTSGVGGLAYEAVAGHG